ncbi:hypothetical protein B0H13DRAFT_2320660 [Mycena leptocephala]|nr:hypothetical protein B0H13DRAFT_2320660 [Mycena leptocephala]
MSPRRRSFSHIDNDRDARADTPSAESVALIRPTSWLRDESCFPEYLDYIAEYLCLFPTSPKRNTKQAVTLLGPLVEERLKDTTSSHTFIPTFADPQYIVPHREEVPRVVAERGCTKQSASVIVMPRSVANPAGFRFSDGTVVPHGAFLEVEARRIRHHRATPQIPARLRDEHRAQHERVGLCELTSRLTDCLECEAPLHNITREGLQYIIDGADYRFGHRAHPHARPRVSGSARDYSPVYESEAYGSAAVWRC